MRRPLLGLLMVTVVAGCQAQPSTEQMLVSSAGPERMRAVVRLARQNRWDNIPIFIRNLQDEDVSVRMAALSALRDQTGADMGFRPADPPEVREAAVSKWQQWWDSRGRQGPQAKPR